MSQDGVHERFRREERVVGSSDRAFGFVFAAVFTLIGLWPLLSGNRTRYWALVCAAGFVILALAAPRMLAPLNRLWLRFGLLLHKITNPIIMGVVFYLAVTPTALVMRALGKDILHRKLDPDAKSYWIERQPHGPDPASMKEQF